MSSTPLLSLASYFELLVPQTAYAQHPVTKLLIDYSINQLGGSWGPKKQPYKQTFFPNTVSTTSLSSVSFPYNTLINALVAKYIYQNAPDCQAVTNLGAVNSSLSSCDTKYTELGTALFTSYMRSQSTGTARDYANLLLTSNWRQTRAAEQYSPGGWKNSELEMYQHFVKYQALGASDSDVRNVYNQLTTTQPILQASNFPNINSWKSYTAWRFNGAFDSNMIKLENFNASDWYAVYPPNKPFQAYARREFIDYSGYRKPAESGSCYSDNALILMGDGSTKRIDTIQPGDIVMSSTPSGASLKRVVEFVASPPRGNRPLYSVNGSAWLTTATHPFVTFTPSGLPTLSFVDHHLANAENPCWAAYPSSALSSIYEVKEASGATAAEGELVYDLIFERKSEDDPEPFCYTVTDGRVSLLTASEAPSPTLFPGATAFVAALARQLTSVTSPLSVVAGVHAADDGDYVSLFDSLGHEAFTIDARGAASREPLQSSGPDMRSVLSPVREHSTPQILAETIERLIGVGGLRLVAEIETGWRHADEATAGAKTSLLTVPLLQLFEYPRTQLVGQPIEIILDRVHSKHARITSSDVRGLVVTLPALTVEAETLPVDAHPSLAVSVGELRMVGEATIKDHWCFVSLFDERWERPMGLLAMRRATVGVKALAARDEWNTRRKMAYGTQLGSLVGTQIRAQ